jgi:hypothetical protein
VNVFEFVSRYKKFRNICPHDIRLNPSMESHLAEPLIQCGAEMKLPTLYDFIAQWKNLIINIICLNTKCKISFVAAI